MNPTNHTMKVAAAQSTPSFLNREKTVKKACDLILEAGKNGAKLIVFPEVFIPGYPDWVWVVPNSQAKQLNELYVELIQNAVSIPDESTRKLCQAAKKAKIYVAIGLHEKNTESSNASLFNSLLYIDDQGEILGTHRKLVPTGGEKMIWAQGDGNTLHTFDTSMGKIGGLICWENYMPLARQTMYASGVEILVVPTWDKNENWLLSLRHIAREGGVFVINCCMAIRMSDIPDRYDFKNLYPTGRDWINTGNSCIINPRGEYIAGPVEKKEEILYGDIDLADILASKRMFDVAGHYARPDVFKFAVDRKSNLNIYNHK
jgi:nitrilase